MSQLHYRGMRRPKTTSQETVIQVIKDGNGSSTAGLKDSEVIRPCSEALRMLLTWT